MPEKKIVLVGPMAAGKTTFKRVFFEDANPLDLLDQSLEPTRGIETDAYKHFSSTIAVWDLAGQENDNWLDEKSDTFEQSNVIACMVSVSQELKDILLFLIKFLKKWKVSETDSTLYILLNKCDLVAESASYNIVVSIEQYMSKKHPEFGDICKRANILRTSIANEYFLRTLTIAYEILGDCIEKRDMQLTREQVKEIRVKINVLSTLQAKNWYTIEMISNSASGGDTQKILDELLARGYVINEREKFYSLSEKGEYFFRAWANHASIAKTKHAMEKIGFFLNLNANLEKIK
ncbi:MAG TPA: hypothetical protein VKM55_01545 [Candidatus Lokiarchaeia archaeon]|nr:hypothetical protein [Candidatus Lokiarchaeia archaeon]